MAIFKPFTEGEPPRDFWRLRRILDKAKYPAGTLTSDITLVNWPQIDYWLGPLLGVSDGERAKHREGARQLSLSLLYWMQTEAPRHERGYGYPGLRLRGDITGTKHGLAKSAYIRGNPPDRGQIHRHRSAGRGRATFGARRSGDVTYRAGRKMRLTR